jgi:hypothetical protein
VAGADVGCGTPHAVNLLAGAPRSTFTDYDIAAIRAEAADRSLTDPSFRTPDATTPAQRVTARRGLRLRRTRTRSTPAAVLAQVDEVPRASRTGDPLGSFSEKVRARASESTEVLPGVQR